MNSSFFSKFIKHVGFSAVIICLFMLTGCNDRNLINDTNIEIGDLSLMISAWSHEGNVVMYRWDGTDEGRTIDIPDVTDHNEKITSLGKYYPFSFGISLKPLDDGFDPWTGPYGKPIPEGTKAYEDAENARKEYIKKNPLYGKVVTYQGDDESLYDGPISYDKMVFTINLGRYINEIHLDNSFGREPYIGFRQEDGSIVFYEPAVYFNCDSQNETFYSENGILYSSKTKEKLEFQMKYPDD